MTESTKTYITEEMKAQIGVEFNRHVSPPVTLSDIRKWSIAIYWPETPPRLFWDEEYAKATRFGGIVAPEDFNPFAWPTERPQAQIELGNTPNAQGLNGGGIGHYYTHIRPGDVITSSSSIKEHREREGRLGLMLFTITETRWTNQKGELVKVYEGTGIRY